MWVRSLQRLKRIARWIGEHTDELVLSGLAAVFFLVAANTQTGWLYLVSSLMVGLLLVAFIGPRRNLKHLSAEYSLPRSGLVGEPASFRVRLKNDSPRGKTHLILVAAPSGWQQEGEAQRVLVDSLPPGRVIARSFTVTPRVRGAHRLGTLRVATAAPLGLFRAEAQLDSEGDLLVLPTGPVLTRLPLLHTARRRAYRSRTFSRAGSSHDLRRIRPYGAGEDIRFVHWPSTARGGELMLREFRESGSVGLHLALDNARDAEFGPYPQTSLEDAVSSAASIVELADRQELGMNLLTFHGAPLRLSHPRRRVALETLARLTAEDPRSIADWLDWVVDQMNAPGDLLILTSRIVPQRCVDRLRSRSRARPAVAYYPAPVYQPGAGPDLEAYEQSCQMLQRAKVACLILDDRERLGDFLERSP